MTRWLFRPTLEELHGRTLPSTKVVVPPDLGPPIQVDPLPSHPLHGDGYGTYTQPVVVDAGVEYQLDARLSLGSVGNFRVRGWVQGTGMVIGGRATGHLVLSNGHGTITLDLHSGELPPFSPLPPELVYSITAGTGAYAGERGYGVAGFSVTPAPTAFGLPLRGRLHIWIT